MATDEIYQFGNISLGGRSGGSEGVLKMNKVGLGWKTSKGASQTVEGSTIRGAKWIRLGRLFQLNLKLKGGVFVKFDGFREQDFEVLKKFLKTNWDVELEEEQLASKGFNWGTVDFKGSMLSFNVSDKKAFEIPLTDVSRSLINKNDVTMEFHQDDTDTGADKQEQLVEIRFHIPDGEGTDPKEFHSKVLAKADIVSTSGKGIAQLQQLPVLTPRGRYNIEMFPTFMKLHGKTYDYKILFTNVSRLFQLPKPDQRHVFFVISLDPPIKQGQTRYPHIVMQFPTDDTLEVNLNLTKESMEKYKDKLPDLDSNMKGHSYDVVSRLFKALTGRKVTFPNTFKSSSGASGIKCTLKANEGYLYPLERSFFFVHKPPTHVRFDEIAHVEFARMTSSSATSTGSRTFDLLITLKNSTVHQFTSIQRFDYTGISAQCSGKSTRRFSTLSPQKK